MEAVDRYCHTLSKGEFDQIPRPLQKLFYTVAIFCSVNNKGNNESCKKILRHYDKLLLTAGIFGRIELAGLINIRAAQYIPEITKGRLKARRMQDLMNRFGTRADSIYFYDDNPQVVRTVRQLGINAILVHRPLYLRPEQLHALVRKKEYDANSVSMVLLDFDKTLALVKFKKRRQTPDIRRTVKVCLGGQRRVNLLFAHLKKLEELGVKVGFITFNTKNVLTKLLARLNWI